MKGKSSAAIHRGKSHTSTSFVKCSSPYEQMKPPSGVYDIKIKKNGFTQARAK
jgi:hypothetical protein